MLFLIIVLSLGLVLQINDSCQQYSYVMVFMESKKNTNNAQPIQIFIDTASCENISTGYIYTPLLVSTTDYIYEDFNVTQSNGIQLIFNNSLKLVGPGLHIKTFVIEASTALTVVGLNREIPSTDSFLSFSVSNLGLEYVTISYATAGICLNACQFAVVAVRNNTTVNIRLPNASFPIEVALGSITYRNGDSFNLLIEKYQSYQIQSKTDLTGTIIHSNKPVVVFSGNKKTNVGWSSKDHLVEQLIPVKSLGRSFVVIPTPDQSVPTYLFFRVVATDGGTTVRINNETTYNLTKHGDWFQLREISDEYFSLISNKPVMVVGFLFHATRYNSSDPCLTVIVPQQQWQSRYTYFAPDIYTNYFIVVIEGFAKNYLLLNGILVNNVTWKQVKSSTLYGTFFKLTQKSNLLTNQLQNVTFGAYIYGWTHLETHCCPAGINLDPAKVQEPISSSTTTEIPTTNLEIKISSSIESSFISSEYELSGKQSDIAEIPSTLIYSSYSNEYSYTRNTNNYTTIFPSSTTVTLSTVKSLCPCRCGDTQMDANHTAELIANIQKELYVDKNTISAITRKKISIPDSRPLSTTIGLIGVIFMLSCLGGIFMCDVRKILRDLQTRGKQL